MDERSWQRGLVNEELIEWEARHGIRALAHLLTYWGSDEVRVCVVGSFDGALGSMPSNAPEILATALGDRLGGDDFRLVVWYPRDEQYPFHELELSRVAPSELQLDALVVLDPASGEQVTQRGRPATVRFANPRWARRTEDEMAQLLGDVAIRELRTYAGQPGEYTPGAPLRHHGSPARRTDPPPQPPDHGPPRRPDRRMVSRAAEDCSTTAA